MKQIFTIPAKLPSLNDYTDECRANKYGANRVKKSAEEIIILFIKTAGLKPVTSPVTVHFTWYETTMKRDKDNVAFAKKFILDALQKAKILPNDNNKYIEGFTDGFVYHKGQKVVVELEELHGAE